MPALAVTVAWAGVRERRLQQGHHEVVFGIQAEWRILEAAFDELNLWDLPGRHVYVDGDGRRLTADLSLDEARAALVAGLARGLVELYDAEVDGYPRLSLDDALDLVSDDGEWSPESASRLVALTPTEAGQRESHAVFARLRSRSPFRAAGAKDPRDFTAEDG